MVEAIILAAVCFLFFFLFWLLENNFHGSRHSGLPWNWPLLGMLPSLIVHAQRAHDKTTQVLQQAKGTFLFKGPWLACMDMIFTVDPDNIHHIMSKNFSNFSKGSKYISIFDVLGDGIFNSEFDSWTHQRNLARKSISHKKFFEFLIKATMSKLEEGVIPILEKAAETKRVVLDLQDVFQRFTFDTACILVTGQDPGCLSLEFPRVPFSEALDQAEEAIFVRHTLPEIIWKLQRWLGIGRERRLAKAMATIDETIHKYVSMKKDQLILSRGTPKGHDDDESADMLTSYIMDTDGSRNSNPPLIEDKQTATNQSKADKRLRDTALNFIVAGRDTTSSALTWFFWSVSKHPEVEDKIREELTKALPETEEPQKQRLFKIEEIQNLVYLHGAICESLRLYPPAPHGYRTAVQEDLLPSGHKVLPNMSIYIPLYAMGRMASIWGEDCLEFKPERWITKQGMIKHEPSYKFVAFNAGPRNCIGREVAFTQMKAVAATIIYNYQVRVVEGHKATPNASIMLGMKHGLPVRVAKRCVL